MKYRDLWDIAWLSQGGVEPAYELINAKLDDHAEAKEVFLENTRDRLKLLASDEQQRDFVYEMSRFIPPDRLNRTVRQDGFWRYMVNTVTEKAQRAQQLVEEERPSLHLGPLFPM